jgi:hypothetical protein
MRKAQAKQSERQGQTSLIPSVKDLVLFFVLHQTDRFGMQATRLARH